MFVLTVAGGVRADRLRLGGQRNSGGQQHDRRTPHRTMGTFRVIDTMQRRFGIVIFAAGLVGALAAVPGAATAAVPVAGPAAAGVSAAPVLPYAVTAVKALPVKSRAQMTGYARAKFGQAWADTDRNGCDTRNDVLRRDLRSYSLEAGTRGCLVFKGTLRDPYTNMVIAVVRGPQSARVQIDRVVALGDAWAKGAQQWPAAKRVAFANDGLNLLAVDGPTTQAKGAGDAAKWLPPAQGYRCQYVARQVSVKRKYGLAVTEAERNAMLRVLRGCPSQRLVVAPSFRLGGGTTISPAPAPQPSPTPHWSYKGAIDAAATYEGTSVNLAIPQATPHPVIDWRTAVATCTSGDAICDRVKVGTVALALASSPTVGTITDKGVTPLMAKRLVYVLRQQGVECFPVGPAGGPATTASICDLTNFVDANTGEVLYSTGVQQGER